MISAFGRYFAISSLACINSTAPSEKLGATKTPTLFSLAILANASRSSAVRPVVPMTILAPYRNVVLAFSKTTFGLVKSTTTSGLVASNAACKSSIITTWQSSLLTISATGIPALDTSTAPTNCNSESCQTAFTTSRPIRPPAPQTKTVVIIVTSFMIISHLYYIIT